MSDANNFSVNQPINPYYKSSQVDLDKAKNEHAEIKRLFEQAGIKVISVPSPTSSQDGVYTANWGLVSGNKAIIARLPKTRQPEENYAKKILESLGKQVIQLPEGLKFSGQGDSLPCGDLLFCGSGYRSDAEAQKIVANELGYKIIQLKTVPQTDKHDNEITNNVTGWPDSFFYDLDLALAIIRPHHNDQKGLIAYCPEAFTAKSKQILSKLSEVDKIEISLTEAKEAFAANLVSTGKTVIMSAKAPKLAEELLKRGLKILTPQITELAKGGGYIRCVALTLD